MNSDQAYYRLIIILVILMMTGLSAPSLAQKQGYFWYFGKNAGLDFTGFDPVPLSNSQMDSPEGSAAVSDSTGKLLFYTDGVNLWNSNHERIKDGMSGDLSSTQSATIIPDPNNAGQYFVFTTKPFVTGSEDNTGGNYYTIKIQSDGTAAVIYDYAAATGNGGLAPNSSEKFAVVPYSNSSGKTGYWFLMHEFNTNVFIKVKLDSIWYPAVRQEIGSVHRNGSGDDGTNRGAAGQMKVNDIGTRLALAVEGGKFFEIFSFNKSTGNLSKPMQIPAGDPGDKLGFILGAYGIEFSPTGTYGFQPTSGNYLYGSTRDGGQIYQWDLALYDQNDPLQLAKSGQIIYSHPNIRFGALQIAPNGKIYVAFNGQDYLGVINAPMRPDCRFEPTGARLINNDTDLGGLSGFGLPSAIPVKMGPEAFYFENLCLGDTTLFYVTNQNGISGTRSLMITKLGPGGSTKILSSTSNEFRYPFPADGNYRIVLLVIRAGNPAPQRYTRELTINPLPVVKLAARDRVPLCWGSSLNLDAGSGAFYEWEIDTINVRRRTITTSNDSMLPLEQYRVKVTDYHGCIGWDTLDVERKNLPSVDSTHSIRAFCGDKNGEAKVYPRGNIQNYNFSWEGFPDVNSNTLTGVNGGDYIVHVINKSTLCEIVDSVHVSELGGSSVKIVSSGDSVLCPGVPVNLTVTGANEIEWLTPSGLSGNNVPVCLDTTTIFRVKAISRDEGRECPTYVTDTIRVYPKNIPDLGPDKTSCTGMTVEINGGGIYKQWNWSDGQSGRIAFLTGNADTLILHATDQNGCVFTDTVGVHFLPSPVFCLGNDTVIYTKDPLMLTGSAGDRYRWNRGDTTPTISIDSSGLYILTVTRDGCSWSDSIRVQFRDPPKLVIDSVISRNVSCNGAGDGSIRIYARSDIGNKLYYSIDNGKTFPDTTGIFEKLSPGIYIIQVKVESERPQLWGYIIINEPDILKAKFCNLPPSCPTCSDGKITVGYISGGTRPYEIFLGGEKKDSVINNLGVGSYLLTVIDSMKCVTTGTVFLAEGKRPVIAADKNDTICPGEQVKLTIGNSDKVEWIYPPNDFRQEITVQPTVTTIYRVKSGKTDTDGYTCETLLEHTVYVFQVKKPDIGDHVTACTGDTIKLDGGDYASWSWSNGLNDRHINLTETADFLILAATDTNGCLQKDTVSVIFYRKPLIELGQDIAECSRDSISIMGGSGEIYHWSTGAETPETWIAKSGKYFLTITSNGCSSTDSINIKLVNPDLLIIDSVSPGDNTCFGSETGSLEIFVHGSGSSYQYSIDGGDTYQPLNRFDNLPAGDSYDIWVMEDSLCYKDYGSPVSIAQPDSIHVTYSLRSPGCETCNDGKLTLQVSGGVPPYQITLSGAPVGMITETMRIGSYTVVVTDANQCTKTVELKLEWLRQIPNVITTNGDGVNDRWKIPLLKYYPDALVKVFSSAGTLVFQSLPGYTIPWDGRYKGNYVPMGTYYYLINLGSGEPPITGYLTILR